jgi:hypothetical protein
MMRAWIGRVFGGGKATRDSTALIESPGFVNGATPMSMIVDSVETLEAEIARARRYEHALSIVVLSTRPPLEGIHGGRATHTNGKPPIDAALPQVVSLLAAAALRDVLRQSDIVCYQPTADRFVLAFAESNADEAREALRRINTLLRDRLRLEACAGLARFPQDALTLEGLVAIAADRARDATAALSSHTAPAPVPSSPVAPEVRSTNGHRPARANGDHLVASPRAHSTRGD